MKHKKKKTVTHLNSSQSGEDLIWQGKSDGSALESRPQTSPASCSLTGLCRNWSPVGISSRASCSSPKYGGSTLAQWNVSHSHRTHDSASRERGESYWEALLSTPGTCLSYLCSPVSAQGMDLKQAILEVVFKGSRHDLCSPGYVSNLLHYSPQLLLIWAQGLVEAAWSRRVEQNQLLHLLA